LYENYFEDITFLQDLKKQYLLQPMQEWSLFGLF
jgi:hypothetical protein